MDLTDFLRQQLDDERANVYGRRATVHAMTCDGFPSDLTESGYAEAGEIDNCDCGGPGFRLREVEAKLRVVEQYERAWDNRRAHPDDLPSAGAVLALLGTCKLLALPYADHPDYDPAWKPGP